MIRQMEQVAFRSRHLERHMHEIDRVAGTKDWVTDLVDAEHIFLHSSLVHMHLGERFQVRLAFNYELIEGTEVELIQLASGQTVQLVSDPLGSTGVSQVLSHLGYHTENTDRGPADEPLQTALREWTGKHRCAVHQISQTILHANTSKRYRYAFVDTRHIYGVYTKVIQRLAEPETDTQPAREAYAWLHESR